MATVTAVVTLGFAVCLWVTATHFDESEIKALGGGAFLTAVITALAKHVFKA